MIDSILDKIFSFWGSFTVIIIFILAYLLNKWIFRKIKKKSGTKTITRQIISFMLFLIAALAFTIVLPINQNLKGQIIGIIGIILSASFTLSSTTIIGNALAGLMNSTIRGFTMGDFIEIENNFGRITKKGLFRTEIQTRDRDLTSLPNLYIATHPVRVVRDTGTIISTTISLGYDIDRHKIEAILLEAARLSNLQKPFVYIDKLGDFSVSYQINGLLEDINKYFTTCSTLKANAMDGLHKGGIEIVSPTFMNQRRTDEIQFIPSKESLSIPEKEKFPDEIIFDKAIKADRIEEKKEYLEKIEKQTRQLKIDLKEADNKDGIKSRIESLKEYKEVLQKNIQEQTKKLDEKK